MATGTLHYDSTTKRVKSWLSGVLTNLNVYAASEVTFTTTGNIDNLDFSNASLIRMNNASEATIRGLVAGFDGQMVTIVSIGAGNVLFAHQNANSSEANRLINYVATGTTPLAAGKGTATYIYDGTTDRWRLASHSQGGWITPAYAAGNFTARVNNWTVDANDVDTLKYWLTGKNLTACASIQLTDVGASNDELRITMPFGWTIAASNSNIFFPGFMQDAGAATALCRVRCQNGNTWWQFEKLSGNWTATTSDNTSVFGSIIMEIA